MIAIRALQTWLKEKGHYSGPLDGLTGPKTREAIAKVTNHLQFQQAERQLRAAEQLFLREKGFDPGDVDGLYGPKTEAAHQAWVTKERDGEIPIPPSQTAHQKPIWPKQSQVPAFYGERGANQRLISPPYKLYYGGQLVKRISVHEKVADSAMRVFDKVHSIYGDDIPKLSLDQYSGSLNVRPMRGGKAWSMHSWGIAIDFDAPHNALHMDHTKAKFAKPEYIPFWEAWEAEGWVSLGRERDYDWMHVQAARL